MALRLPVSSNPKPRVSKAPGLSVNPKTASAGPSPALVVPNNL